MADSEEIKIQKIEMPGAGPGEDGSVESRLAKLEIDFNAMARRSGNEEIRGILHFQSFSANPSVGREGDVCVVAGKLKVYTSGAWVVVGTQT